jgi:hypothetical protein
MITSRSSNAGLGDAMIFPNEQPRESIPLTQPDRRVYPRYTVHVPIEIREQGSDVPLRLETTDLSHGLCCVQLMMTLVLGTPPFGSIAPQSTSADVS